MSYGELGSVRLVLEDSSQVTLDEAFLIDSNIIGRGDRGSVMIPVSNVSSLERREVQGFEIFFVANAASLAFLILATHSEYWAPGLLR